MTDLITEGKGEEGLALERLATYLFLTIPGIIVKNRRVGKGGEVDVLVGNLGGPGRPFGWFGDYFLVECKDKAEDPVSESDFGHFLTKLNLTKTKQGAIVSRWGFSGSAGKGRAYAKRDQKTAFSEMGVAVLDISVHEIEMLNKLDDWLMLLQRKYEEIRFN